MANRKAKSDLLALLPHQERVNFEMFKAIETLGKKLERVEDERDSLTQRLALIESAATVDEKTGRLYLPVAVDQNNTPPPTNHASASKWVVTASLMSCAFALLALGLVLSRTPVPTLTKTQLAALDAISQPRLVKLDRKSWQNVENDVDRYADASVSSAPSVWQETRTERDTVVADAKQIKILTEIAPATGVLEDVKSTVEPVVTIAEVKLVPTPVVQEQKEAPKTPIANPVEKLAEKQIEKSAKKQTAKDEDRVVSHAGLAPEPEMAVIAPIVTEDVVVAEQKPRIGLIGMDTRLPEKLKLLEVRAFEGVGEAQHDLATIYASGEMVTQDYKRAVYWFSKASESGIANADYNLGVMFQQGMGINRDVVKAVGWYHRAADLGHPEAMYNLGISYIEGIGAARNTDKGIHWFKQAANAGVLQAAYNLGVLNESSFVGAADTATALEWYLLAAEQGHDDAKASVARIQSVYDAETENALNLADLVEPAAGAVGDEPEMVGEGDASPLDEEGRLMEPVFHASLVADIQSALVDKGLLPSGSSNGALDPRTEDAIRSWQQSSGMSVTGQPSRGLLESLR